MNNRILLYIATVIFFLTCAQVSLGTDIHNGVVASASPEATQVGIDILESGGNAIDAAVAVSFALGVTEPAGSGIGGQTFMLVHPPDGKPFVINGTSLAPKNLPGKIAEDDISGHRATTVPSTVKILDFAWRKFGSGSKSWQELLEPAIHYAREGYRLGHFRYRSLARYAHLLKQNETAASLYLDDNGRLPKQGSVIKTPLLADTLEILADRGGDDFYNGEIANAIIEDMKENNGWLRKEDLANFPEPRIEQPLTDTYRGWDVYTLPPPTGGWVVLQALNILEHAPEKDLADIDRNRWIWLAETLQLVHGNRLQTPITDLENYQQQINLKINKKKSAQMLRLLNRPGGETTHFSIVDKQGMVVSVTQSLNAYFGARVANPVLGFLYNDYMNEFNLENVHHPYYLQPQAMPYSSMSAVILARDGKPAMALGSPGSKRIISAVVQVISDWIDIGRGIKSAVAAPRIHVVPDEELFMEAWRKNIPNALLLDLELRGYTIVRPLSSLYKENLNPYFGGVHAVALENGKWTGAADPRRDGTVGISQ